MFIQYIIQFSHVITQELMMIYDRNNAKGELLQFLLNNKLNVQDILCANVSYKTHAYNTYPSFTSIMMVNDDVSEFVNSLDFTCDEYGTRKLSGSITFKNGAKAKRTNNWEFTEPARHQENFLYAVAG